MVEETEWLGEETSSAPLKSLEWRMGERGETEVLCLRKHLGPISVRYVAAGRKEGEAASYSVYAEYRDMAIHSVRALVGYTSSAEKAVSLCRYLAASLTLPKESYESDF